MLRHRIYSNYYNLSLQGKVPPVLCGIEDHPAMVPEFDSILELTSFKCLVCNCKITPGLMRTKQMINEIRKVTQ